MKISYISHSILPSHYANSVHVMKMCQAMATSGHDVTLFAKVGDKGCSDIYQFYDVKKNFQIECINLSSLKPLRPFIFLTDLRRAIKRQPLPDLFYSRHSYALPILTALNKHIIFEAHSPPLNLIEEKILHRLFSCKNFKHLVVISSKLREIFLSRYPTLKAQDIIVAHDGADVAEPHQTRNEEQHKESLNIGYAGNLYKGRGIELILQLAIRLPKHSFHIVGGGSHDLKRWANKSQSKNLFFHGFTPPSQLKDFYQNMDILLAPYQHAVSVGNNKGNSVEWMSPLKIFEYMAQRKAIIASDLPAIREVLEDQKDALLIPPDNISAWQTSIERLLDPALRASIGSHAQEKLRSHYTWTSRAIHVLREAPQRRIS